METPDCQRIILGCGNFGGVGSLPELIGRGDTALNAHALLSQALEFGITRFDTANSYAGGASEIILGEWIARQPAKVRPRLSVSTKVGNSHACSRGDRPLSKSQIRLHLEKSLRRLHVDRITTLYAHEPDPYTPIEETLEAFTEAVREGKIGGFGLSNVSLSFVRRFFAAAGSATQYLTHVQNEFHYLHTDDLAELIPFLAARGVRYVSFSPLAGGILSGKYANAIPHGSRLELRPEPYLRFLDPEGKRKILTFVEQAASEGEMPAARALKFVLKTAGVDSAIIGPRKLEHYDSLGFKFRAN